MAQKRMFDKSIIETDNFLNISLSAKAIYFLLGMEADDEGFVSPSRILRLYGGEKGDLKNLIDTGLIIPFKSGVVVITDWNQNNWLDIRRIKPTQYQKEKKLLTLSDARKYVLSQCLAEAKPEESSIEERRVEEDSPLGIEKSEIEEIFNLWNSHPIFTGSCKNITAKKKLLPKCKEINSDIVSAFQKLKDYKVEDMRLSLKNYIQDIINRSPENDYAKHRFSFYEFFKQANGFKKYLNK